MNTKPRRRKSRFRDRNQKNGVSRNNRTDYSKYINKRVEEVETSNAYENQLRFSNMAISQSLLDLIQSKGYDKPTEIQEKTIPEALGRRDIVGIAGTGTGKTASFLIPIIQQLIQNEQDNFALIITPTRELALQINSEWRSLTRGLGLFSSCLIGGASMSDAIKNLRKTNHLIVGTPGRLLDMSKRGFLKFDNFKMLVLDEFDRMLDMGFSKDIDQIHKMMKKKSQTLLFSATLDKSQQNLIDQMTNDPVRVTVKSTENVSAQIEQDVCYVKGQDKFQILKGIIEEPQNKKTILFCETRRNADKMLKRLNQDQIRTDVIHGDKSQKVREIALRKFRRGQIRVLVATDVVARGIDVSDVDLVINYEVPRNYTDYIHRIGRTGRAGKRGKAITMID